ncbi:hypothetical protein [Cryobacterium sp. TMS1-13-1]|uniref:hypothetical protein n=1 Tax=Cryobacterium sp. TMS1-13-1 TaxID=1259220 RepID=UPI001F544E4E|nr:hypothetical protein [Cryobacterium sp. TMS1-13-1]
MSGSSAVTSPPGEVRQVAAPSSLSSKSTGSRLETTTSVYAPVAVSSGAASAPESSSAVWSRSNRVESAE